MAFTMSYGAAPSPAPIGASPAAPAPKKRVPTRIRKGNSLQAQAQALFDPALASSGDASAPRPQTEMPDNGDAALLVPAEVSAEAESTQGGKPTRE